MVLSIVIICLGVVTAIISNFVSHKSERKLSRTIAWISLFITVGIIVWSGIENITTTQQLQRLQPKLHLLSQIQGKSNDGLYYIGLFFQSPHPSISSSANINIEFSNNYIFYSEARVRGIHKSPREILDLEKNRTDDVLKTIGSKLFETTWNAIPDEFLILRF